MSLVPALVLCAAGAQGPSLGRHELGVQLLAALAADEQTRGGGGGGGIELGLPLVSFPAQGLRLLLRLRASVLMGAGLVYGFDLGLALGLRRAGTWQPDAGLYGVYLGGALVRTIDADGQLASSPLAVQVGLNPLRFELSDGWLSLLGSRVGPTLSHSGRPPFALSLTVFELGHSF